MNITITSKGSHRPIRQVTFLIDGVPHQENATVYLLRNGGIQVVADHLNAFQIDTLTRELSKIPGFIEFDVYQDQYQQGHNHVVYS